MCKYLKLAKRNGKYGYVDKNKKPVIPFVFDDAKEFNGPYAIVRINQYGHFLIDQKGNNIFKRPFKGIEPAYKSYKDNDNCIYNYCLHDENEYTAVIDNNLNIIVPWGRYDLEYHRASEGIYEIKSPFYRYGFAGLGKIIAPCVYKRIYGFQNGHAIVQNENKKWGLINHLGDILIPTIYDELDVSEGIVYAKLNDKFGYLDYMGNTIIPFIYTDAKCFKNGLAEVKLENGEQVKIDRSGKIVKETKYSPKPIKGNGERKLKTIVKIGKINQKNYNIFKKLEGKVVELKHKLLVEYLVYYCAPYTGSGEEYVPKGTRFYVSQHMNAHCFYCDINNPSITNKICEKEINFPKNPLLKGRFNGISYFLTQDQLLKSTRVVSDTITDEFKKLR